MNYLLCSHQDNYELLNYAINKNDHNKCAMCCISEMCGMSARNIYGMNVHGTQQPMQHI